ncbi:MULTISPECIES: helix-turn-helix domain-containing protein [Flavobacterium]|uniref:helix-turn-helix domain-containing protein n=1 Tax=Flavobacterium TaxID=237 RepID=UPI001FCB7D2F|nr:MULTISPECIES: helix-turn-helix transcriptional regulator [Flavobacterium]UOK41718.1 helix-turn-helix domain-containing protein [Flavobacterium enshiense]
MIKSKNYLRDALGLTQEETAMLLRVTKSQLAMFEIGQRDLPTKAMLKLITMHNYLQNKEQEKVQHIDQKSENSKIIKLLEVEIVKNKYKQALLERELARLKSNHQKSLSNLQLAEYLETQLEEGEKPGKEFIGVIRTKGLRGMDKNGLSAQKKLELKINALQKYQNELEKELKHYKFSIND